MSKPTFFVKDITHFLLKSKAQKYVVEKVQKLKYKTIASPDELHEFEFMLQNILDDARDMNVNARKMRVECEIDFEGTRHFYLNVDGKGNGNFCIVHVCYIRGPWKEVKNG